MVTPQGVNAACFEVKEFTRHNVETYVSDQVKCGFYRIGTVTPRMDNKRFRTLFEFRVCYFGRSDDNNSSLRRRLCDHLVEGGNPAEPHIYSDKLFFAVWECDSSEEAYEQELKDYEAFFTEEGARRTGRGYTNNPGTSHDYHKINPETPPVCGFVYVDNTNIPAKPKNE